MPPTLAEIGERLAGEGPAPIVRRAYAVHGVRYDLRTPSARFAALADDALGRVLPGPATDAARTETVWVAPQADVVDSRDRLLKALTLGPLPPVEAALQIDWRRDERLTYVQFTSQAFWAWDRTAGVSLILVRLTGPDEGLDPGARSVLTLMLAEQSLSRGRCLCHAGGVELDGRAVLVAGPSGSGKSTVTTALWAAGGRLMGDDLCLIDPAGGSAVVFGLLEPLHLRRDVRGHFGGLIPPDAVPTYGRDKFAVDPGARGPGSIIDRLLPDVLVVPCYDGSEPTLVEMTRAEAFLRLTEACRFLPDHVRHPTVHAAVNAVLDRSRWYRLHTGPRIGLIADAVCRALA